MPGKKGGIENYTHWLATTLLDHQIEVEVAALQVKEKADYVYDGIKVNNLNEDLAAFEKVLQDGLYDICHFHEYSEYGGIEIPWFKKARQFVTKVFFTFHLPYLTCYKNDFRYNGTEDCNNFSDSMRCTNCIIAERFSYKKWRNGGLLKLLQASLSITGKSRMQEEKVLLKHQHLTELIASCDQVFLIAGWFDQLLRDNGYKSEKINLLPNILQQRSIKANKSAMSFQKNKLVFAGRIQYQKGLHLLCEAVRKMNCYSLEIDVFGNVVDESYFNFCQKRFSFNYKGIIPRQELMGLLPLYDFLVLPSVFTEMYPMVIQEAFNAQLPVIASSAKGNRDAINDGVDGFLFNYDDADDLAATIDKAYKLKKEGWSLQPEKVKTSKDAINKILSFYK